MAAKLVRKKAGFKSIEIFKDQIIGIGAFGAVCHAQCDDLPCAAKILHPTIFAMGGLYKNAQQFEQECKFIRTVQHPNLVRYLGIHYDDTTGQPVLLMEMMDENLTHFLESTPAEIPYHLQVNFCRDIALALSFLHSNDIIHRNLSANNVLLIYKARAKVSDFGMARLSSFDPKRSFLEYTMSSTTHPYMPPEGFRNNPNYDKEIDCFSFGVIVVQILTQKFPTPTDRLRSLENADGKLSYAIIPEIERRKDDISKIDPKHPLLPIALPCLNDNSTQRPSAHKLCKNMKKLQESDEYRESVSGTPKQCSRASNGGASSEKRANQGNQMKSSEDADKSTTKLEETKSNNTTKASNSHVTEEKREKYYDGGEHPKPQEMVVIAAEVHTMEDETLPEQSSLRERAKPSDQHPSNHQDQNQKLQKESALDKNEKAPEEFNEVPSPQDIKPGGSSREGNHGVPSANNVSEKSEKSMHEINDSIKDEEISKPVQDDLTKVHCDGPQHKNVIEDELKSSEGSGRVTQTDVTADVSENAIQDSGPEDVQQEIQNDINVTNKNDKERKPSQNADIVENNLQDVGTKHEDAGTTEQSMEEGKRNDGASATKRSELESTKASITEQPKRKSEQDGMEKPEIESNVKCDDTSVTEQAKQENKQDGTEEPKLEDKCDNAASVTEQPSRQDGMEEPGLQRKHDSASVTEQAKKESKQDSMEQESKHNNVEPQKQESKGDDAQPDQKKAKESKEVPTNGGIEVANNSPEITVIAAGSDGGATKPESGSEERKKQKSKFTLFSRKKASKSKQDAKGSLKENDKPDDYGRQRSKTYGGGKKLKIKKQKEKKDSTPKDDSKSSKRKIKKKDRKKSRKYMRILMIGLDAAGKTTMLWKIKLGETVTTIPTVGFNVQTVKYNKMKFDIWDVGGQDKIRPLWRHYYSGTEGLIFVVDCADRERMNEAREEFHSAINNADMMRDANILVLANKQDLPNALKAEEVEDKMELHKLRDRNWHIHPTCATSGEGLYEGLEWLRAQHLGEEYGPAEAQSDTLDRKRLASV